VRDAQKKSREHLKKYAKNADEIRANTKSPAKLLAEKAAAQAVPYAGDGMREVAGGCP
jgi:F0F1-type ATP synthase membrane subunit b/b'